MRLLTVVPARLTDFTNLLFSSYNRGIRCSEVCLVVTPLARRLGRKRTYPDLTATH